MGFWKIVILIHFTGAVVAWIISRKEMHKSVSWLVNESIADIIALLFWLIAWEYAAAKNIIYWITEKYVIWKVIRILKKNNLYHHIENQL